MLLVGQTCSGKTTLSRILHEHGLEIRSASRALARVGQARGRKVDDRSSLSQLGSELRRSGGLGEFHEELFLNWNGETSILVDGPRFKETFDYARRLHPEPKIVYLHCADVTRRTRYELTSNSLTWAEVNLLETEVSVLEFSSIANLVIDTTNADMSTIARQVVQSLAFN